MGSGAFGWTTVHVVHSDGCDPEEAGPG